jgi:hypothetical protein
MGLVGVLTLAWLGFGLCLASMEDNLVESRVGGQPEEALPLGLPSDEESFNQLSPFPYSPNSGTHHFVSSTFPGDYQ